MGVVKLGDVARESRLKWTKSKQDVPSYHMMAIRR